MASKLAQNESTEEIILSALKQRAISGLVTDGSVRDTDEILDYGSPALHSPQQPVRPSCHAALGMQRRRSSFPGTTVRPEMVNCWRQGWCYVVPRRSEGILPGSLTGREEIEVTVKEGAHHEPRTPGKAPSRERKD
jgi:hypothetical protein